MTTATPVGLRALGADDVPAMVELNELCDIAETGEPDHEVLQWIRDGAADYRAFGVFDDAGLAACGWIDPDEHGHVGFEMDVRVRPGVDWSVGDQVLAALRAAAVEVDPARPLHYFANASGERARRWVEGHGGTVIRHFWRMQIDLDGPLPAPTPGPGVTIRRVADDETDLQTVFGIVDTSFADHFGHQPGRTYDVWIRQIRRRSNLDLSTWWLAELDGEPVAALMGWTMPHAQLGQIGHVGTLGTLRAARGRGIGTALLQTAFAEFGRRGLRRVTLGVDAANPTGAVRLYESVGMSSSHEWVLYELTPPVTSC